MLLVVSLGTKMNQTKKTNITNETRTKSKELREIRFRTMVGGEDGGFSGAKNKNEYRNPKGRPVCISQTKP